MKSWITLFAFLVSGLAVAQDSDPVVLNGPRLDVVILNGPKQNALICRGRKKNIAGCVTPPQATYTPDPDYPEKARKKHQRGTVLLDLLVGADGLTRAARVTQGINQELDGAALRAVKKWKFTPAFRDGKPVAARIDVEVSFRLY